MLASLKEMLGAHRRPARLCWYGDHVPIMPGVYASLGYPKGHTEYLVWSNRQKEKAPTEALSLDQLALRLLKA